MQDSFGRCSSFGHARPGAIWRDGFEELNWVAYDRLLLLGERSPKLGQGDILQLPDPLSGHPEFLADFFVESDKGKLEDQLGAILKIGCRFLSLFTPATGASRRMCELMPRTNPPTGNGSGS